MNTQIVSDDIKLKALVYRWNQFHTTHVDCVLANVIFTSLILILTLFYTSYTSTLVIFYTNH